MELFAGQIIKLDENNKLNLKSVISQAQAQASDGWLS